MQQMLQGFKKFLMQGDLIVIAVGLVVALAFSTLIKAFTDSIVTPIINAFRGGGGANGLSWQINNPSSVVQFGSFISAVIYFVIFMAVIYFVLVVPYRAYMAKRGTPVFGDPAPTQTCPACLSSDLPVGATKCKYCATDISPVE